MEVESEAAVTKIIINQQKDEIKNIVAHQT